MRMYTFKYLETNRDRVHHLISENYKGYRIERFSYYSHNTYRIYKDKEFLVEFFQEDESDIEFNAAVKGYIDAIYALDCILYVEMSNRNMS